MDGFFLNWETWSACSVTCAEGTRTRSRMCVEPQFDGAPCDGPTDQEEDCSGPECPGEMFVYLALHRYIFTCTVPNQKSISILFSI